MVLRTNKARIRGQIIFESSQNVSVVKMPKLYSLSLIPRAYTVKEKTNFSKLSSDLHSMLCSTHARKRYSTKNLAHNLTP